MVLHIQYVFFIQKWVFSFQTSVWVFVTQTLRIKKKKRKKKEREKKQELRCRGTGLKDQRDMGSSDRRTGQEARETAGHAVY